MAQNEDEVNPFIPQPHIIHEKRSGEIANMHRLVVDGVAGRWVRAFDEFAVHESGYAASPWTCTVLPKIFQFNTKWATEVEPKPIKDYYTDSELGLDEWKPKGK